MTHVAPSDDTSAMTPPTTLTRLAAVSFAFSLGLHAASYPPYPITIHGFGKQTVPSTIGGSEPDSTLVETAPGVFYGTTKGGGKYDCGTLFKITSAGAFAKLHDFIPAEGCYPTGRLIQAGDGNLYGTAAGSAFVPDNSSLFKSDLAGDVTIVSDFPVSSLLEYQAPTLAADGSIYTVVTKLSEGFGVDVLPVGSFVLHIALDGTKEQVGAPFAVSYLPTPLTLASDGNLYGVYEVQTGSTDAVVVYRVSSSSVQPILSMPDSVVGDAPVAVGQGSDKKLYFATQSTLASASLNGRDYTVVQTAGSDTCAVFETGFLLGSDGQLYAGCGALYPTENGSIYYVESGGSFHFYTTVFGGAVTLASQSALAVEGMDGNFYGEVAGVAEPTSTSYYGSVYSLATGLTAPAPTASLLTPPIGPPGTAVAIYGDHLLGATAVSFNGVPASFQTIGVNLISAIVPDGAATGDVSVTTANGIGQSAEKFVVTQ